MMIVLSTIGFDISGHVVLNASPASTAQVYERRNSKNATLDGLSTISDMGYTASDNVLLIKCDEITKEDADRLVYLIKRYPLLHLSNSDGFFIGAMNTLRIDKIPVEFLFQVREQIA